MALMHDYVIRANSTTTPRLKKKFFAFVVVVWLFYSTLLPWEFIYEKLRNFAISKRGLVLKFARLI